MFKCHLCGNDVEPKRALVPAVLDVLTDFGKTALEEVVLNNHVVCFGCAGKVCHGCPEAKLNFIGAVWDEIRRQLDEKARIEAEAEEAKLNAEAEKVRQILEAHQRGVAACETTRPLLPIPIRLDLKGAAAHNHLRKVSRTLGGGNDKAEKRARQEMRNAIRELKAARNTRLTEAILQAS